jgi:hypothetical protein
MPTSTPIPNEIIDKMVAAMPAIYINGMAVQVAGGTGRLFFTERYGDNVSLRVSIAVPPEALLMFRDILVEHCKQLELQMVRN